MTAFLVSFGICLASAAIIIVLHFQMKFRLDAADLPVKWFMTPADDFRMWRTYRNEAPARNWPIWPFYAYRVLFFVFVLSGIVVLFNADKLDKLLGGLAR